VGDVEVETAGGATRHGRLPVVTGNIIGKILFQVNRENPIGRVRWGLRQAENRGWSV
jgi:hypothetical protein